MGDFIRFFEAISFENSWPIYLILYGGGLILTIVAISKNSKKKKLSKEKENNDLE